MNQNRNTKLTASPAKQAPARKEKHRFRLFIISLVCLPVPYGYLMLCGLIFDRWLKLYDAVPFIFWSFLLFCVAELAFVVTSLILALRSPAHRGNTAKKNGK